MFGWFINLDSKNKNPHQKWWIAKINMKTINFVPGATNRQCISSWTIYTFLMIFYSVNIILCNIFLKSKIIKDSKVFWEKIQCAVPDHKNGKKLPLKYNPTVGLFYANNLFFQFCLGDFKVNYPVNLENYFFVSF